MSDLPRGRFGLPARRSRVRLDFLFVARPVKGTRVRSHTHGALEIVYYVEGEGSTTVGRAPCRIVRNVFTVIPAGVRHDQYSKTNLVAVCVGMRGSGLEDLEGSYHDRHGVLRRPMERLLKEIAHGETGFEAVCEGLVLQIVGLTRRVAAAGPASPPKKAIVDRALEMIHEHEGALSVGDLSEKLYVSKDYLRHLFKEYAQTSPLRHIIATRIERGKDLLARLELSIAEVAAQCGFDNPYYFSRLFRQVTRQTPSQFRRSLVR